jgi:hypothetical protein
MFNQNKRSRKEYRNRGGVCGAGCRRLVSDLAFTACIHVRDVSGRPQGTPEPVVPSSNVVNTSSAAADGTEVVASSPVDSQVRQLTISGNARQATISRDGKTIVYVERSQGGDSLWVRQTSQSRTSAGVRFVMPESGVQLLGASITWDGSAIYYLRDNGNTHYELWRASILGGSLKRVLEHADSLVGWSPDGTQMAFLRRNIGGTTTHTLYVAKADGSDARVVKVRHAARSLSSRKQQKRQWYSASRMVAGWNPHRIGRSGGKGQESPRGGRECEVG